MSFPHPRVGGAEGGGGSGGGGYVSDGADLDVLRQARGGGREVCGGKGRDNPPAAAHECGKHGQSPDLEWKAGVLPLHGVIGAAAQARGRGRVWAWARARIASRSDGGGCTSSRRPAWTIWLGMAWPTRAGKRCAAAISRARSMPVS